jgi:hypothetical protein
MVTKEEFQEIGKKYGLTIYESIFSGFLTYVKDGMAISVYDRENKIVGVNTKIFMGRVYDTKVVNNTKELENELQTTLKHLKEYKIRQKIDRIKEDFE